jgi:hypothetical protein
MRQGPWSSNERKPYGAPQPRVHMLRGAGLEPIQPLGLRFLDAPLPESFIPSDARPLP